MYSILLTTQEEQEQLDVGYLVKNNIFCRNTLKSINRELHDISCLAFTEESLRQSIFVNDFIDILKSYLAFRPDLKLLFFTNTPAEWVNLIEFLKNMEAYDVSGYDITNSYDIQDKITLLLNTVTGLVTNIHSIKTVQGTQDIDMDFLTRLNYNMQINADLKALSRLVENNPDKLKDIIQDYEQLKKDMAEYQDLITHSTLSNDTTSHENSLLESENLKLREQLGEFSKHYKKLYDNFHVLHSVYTDMLNQINLAKQSQLQFYDMPFEFELNNLKTVYFKEYLPVNYFNTFLYNLSDYLNYLKIPHKILIIENPSAKSRIPYWNDVLKDKGVYVTHIPEYSVAELSKNDVIVVYNNPYYILEQFFNKNELQMKLLLVYDKTGSPHTYINPCLKFNLVSKIKYCECFKVDPLITISNDEDHVLGLKRIEDFDVLKSVDYLRQSALYTDTFTEVIQTIQSYGEFGGE